LVFAGLEAGHAAEEVVRDGVTLIDHIIASGDGHEIVRVVVGAGVEGLGAARAAGPGARGSV